MRTQSLQAVLLSGHKEDAVEIPFDPAERLGASSEPLSPGRRGYRVRATVNDVAFESAIVARSKRFWLLVPPDVVKASGAAVGDTVRVSVRA